MSEQNYYTTKFFQKHLLTTEMKKTEKLLNKPVYLGLSILELCKILMCELLYDYVKPKYGENAKLYYIVTDSFIVHVKTDAIDKIIAEDAEARFGNSNFELGRPLSNKIKK